MFAKLVLASILVAAYATEAPTISLDLDAAGLRKKGAHYKSWRSEKKANTKWVHHCKAASKYASKRCALPKARAYDHHDSDVKVTSNICLINKAPKNGVGTGNVMECRKTKPDYNLRSEYIIKYDAKDDSGNKADQVIFAIILDDEERPTFTNWKSYTYECNKSASRFNVRKPSARDNIDTKMKVTIDGTTNKVERRYPVHSRKYKFFTQDFANVFGYKSANNKAHATRTIVVRDTKRPVITDVKDWSIECSKGKVGRNKLAGCHDDCDQLKGEKKSVGVCFGSYRRSVRIAGKYSYFNSGKATGCEHRHHYLYDYKGTDCVWTSNKHHLKHGHAFQNAFLKFQMLEYGNLEDDDYLLIQLKFYGSKGTNTGWIDTVKLRDDVLGWVWTTVYDAPGTGYFAHKGKVNKDWKTFHAAMERNHHYVQIKVTLHSNSNFHERHVVDNLEVFGTECTDYFMATSQSSFNVRYQCKDKAGRSAMSTTTKVSITDNTRPTIHYFGNHVIEHSAGVTDHMGNYLRGHWCKDSCVSNKKLEKSKKHSHIEFLTKGCTHGTKSTHGKAYFNTLKPGTYYQKFTCNDGNGNTALAKCRTIINEDKKKPVITVLGSDDEVLEATYSENYVDDGATCSDQVDGVISQDVEVSGDVVNMGKRGVYKIHYNCKDAARNSADQLTRTVRIVDVTCPSCKMYKLKKTYREASFVYVDAGAKCIDDISLGKHKVDVKGKVNYNVINTYYLTYDITDQAGNDNRGKCPDCKYMHRKRVGRRWVKQKKCKGAKREIRTIIVKDTLKPTIHLSFGKKTIHKSAAKDTGLNNQSNPAGKYMAETSVNGWVIGAIASAVAGVALLALGNHKVATTVPV